MSERHPALTPTEALAQLKSIGATDDDDEEVTSTTLTAVSTVVEDQKRPSDTKSFLAVIGLVHKKHGQLSRRIRRIENLIIFVSGGSTVIFLAWEMFRSLYLHK